MCALFGFVDYKHRQSPAFLTNLYDNLAVACEERGINASGVAYLHNDRLLIHKNPVRASELGFRIHRDVHTVMGHARLTTQGPEQKNYNNHPFEGRLEGYDFALAHNGVIWNDKSLRQHELLPLTTIETDSYIIVQLLESRANLSLKTLSEVAELLEGSFTVSILDDSGNLFIIKGSNPIYVIDFTVEGLLVYASTEAILWRALANTTILSDASRHKFAEFDVLTLVNGDILRISKSGEISRHTFNTNDSLYNCESEDFPMDQAMLEHLMVCSQEAGHSADHVFELLHEGHSLVEIAEYLGCNYQ